MNRFRKRYILLSLPLGFALIHCAALPDLLPEEKRQKSFSTNVTFSKEKMWERANVWLAKAFRDSRTVVHWRERESGRIIGKAYAYCPSGCQGVYGSGWTHVAYTIDLRIRDSKVQIVFDDIRGVFWTQYGYDVVNAPTSDGELETLMACLKASLPRLNKELFEAQD